MGSTLQAPGAPEISHLIPGVPPPAGLYISPNEQLVVDSWAYMGQQPLWIKLRVLRPGGYVDTSYYQHQPNADRSRATTYHDLAEGHLLTAMVLATGLLYKRGQCFVNVGLQRGEGAVGIYHHQLIAGYVTSCSALVWPWAQIQSSVEGPGLIRRDAWTDPAAGAEISVTVPAGARWRLHSIRFVFVTDATALNREVDLVIDDGATTLLIIEPPALQGAGGTRGYNYGADFPSLNALTQEFLIPLPVGLILIAGYRLRTVTVNLQAGDNYGAPQVMFEEWIEP
jgi:hypothetical protein